MRVSVNKASIAMLIAELADQLAEQKLAELLLRQRQQVKTEYEMAEEAQRTLRRLPKR